MAQQQTKAGDNCIHCDGKLAFHHFSNMYWDGKAWLLYPLTDKAGEAADKARELNAKIGMPVKYPQARMVACSMCRIPVSPDHPLQLKINAEWAERDAKDKEEAAKKPLVDATQVAKQFNPLQALEENYNETKRENIELKARVKKMEADIASLLKRQNRPAEAMAR